MICTNASQSSQVIRNLPWATLDFTNPEPVSEITETSHHLQDGSRHGHDQRSRRCWECWLMGTRQSVIKLIDWCYQSFICVGPVKIRRSLSRHTRKITHIILSGLSQDGLSQYDAISKMILTRPFVTHNHKDLTHSNSKVKRLLLILLH